MHTYMYTCHHMHSMYNDAYIHTYNHTYIHSKIYKYVHLNIFELFSTIFQVLCGLD